MLAANMGCYRKMEGDASSFLLLLLSLSSPFSLQPPPTPCPLRLHSLIRCSCRSVGAVACRYLANWRWKLPWWLQSICESVMDKCFLPAEGFDCDHARRHARAQYSVERVVLFRSSTVPGLVPSTTLAYPSLARLVWVGRCLQIRPGYTGPGPLRRFRMGAPRV
ncbi:hypothetical protein F5883DRAFT_158854 [Diaporthe sp. PMI_573]|nr:hypothetical protein F5883DRAFT_158854 [Diaporthaceae sp. PMI_573]